MARLSVTIPDEAYKALEDLAAQSGGVLADEVREAIDTHLKSKGVKVEVKIKRGGDRRSKSD